MAQQSSLSERNYLWKSKKPILVSIAVVGLVIFLVIPIIPVRVTVTRTTTKNLQYDSAVYGPFGLVPESVNVTNKDVIGGTFSVTMRMWYQPPLGQKQLEDTSTQSSLIPAKATHRFDLPSDWFIDGFMHTFTYSVSPPTKQVAYNVTETHYKSLLNLLLERI